LDDALLSDLTERVYGATYHEAKQTLNLVPERVFGVDMVRYVERWLLEAAGREIPGRVGLAASSNEEPGPPQTLG
jgi:hypothetical protein